MPTSYTADIEKGITFEQYAWSCARAFGALVLMRDDPADAPIPEKFEASDYHKKAIAKAEAELKEFTDMPHDQAEAECRKEFLSELASYRKRLVDKAELKKKYESMLEKCKAFVAPSDDHVEYRQFMINQIQKSIEFDCSTSYMESPKQLSAEAWLMNKINKANRDIAYHTAEHEKELERVNRINKWIQQLRNALSNK